MTIHLSLNLNMAGNQFPTVQYLKLDTVPRTNTQAVNDRAWNSNGQAVTPLRHTHITS